MLNLMKLELKKYDMTWYVKGAVISTLLAAICIALIPFMMSAFEGSGAFLNYSGAFTTINRVTGSIFIVFASVLIAKLIIDEYKNRTITVLFTYPVSRKKILMAKLLLIVIITFVTIAISTGIVTTVFLLTDAVLNYINEPLTVQLILQQVILITASALAYSGISLIPIFFGMLRKSVPATIVSSLIIIGVLGFNTNEFSVENIVAVPVTFCVAGLIVAFFSIRNVDKEDI